MCVSVLFALSSFDTFAFNFQIDKAKVRMSLAPGWSDGSTIVVENKDPEPLKMRVYVSDWEYSDKDGSKNFLPANSHALSCADWVKFYPADFTIPAKGSQKVNFVVEVPKDAKGGHYAVLFFEIQTGAVWDEARGSFVQVYNRLGSLFYVEPEGTIVREATIDDFSIDELGGVLKVALSFANAGNVDITTQGTFDIINSEGFVLTRGKFEEIYTLPGDKARISATSEGAVFSKGTYDVIVTFDVTGATLVGEWQITVDESGKITQVKKIGQ